MEKAYLIICNTNYQILNAIQLKLTLLKDNYVSVWISDHIKNAKTLCENINNINLFQNVQYLKSYNQVKKQNIIGSFIQIMKLGCGYTSISNNNICNINKIITYNFDVSYYNIVNAIEKYKMNIEWSKMDEGIFSYNTDFYMKGLRPSCIKVLRRLRGKKDVLKDFNEFYCSIPLLKTIHSEWKTIIIPSISFNKEEMQNVLSYVYNYDKKDLKEKYIFFASSSDIDGNSFGETNIILKIAELVGKDNFIVKCHPRDNRNIFENYGIKVFKENNIPWEVIQIINDYSDKVFLTVTSGAFITVESWLPTKNKFLLLYPEIKKFPLSYEEYINRIDNMIENLHKNKLVKNVLKTDINGLSEILNINKNIDSKDKKIRDLL